MALAKRGRKSGIEPPVEDEVEESSGDGGFDKSQGAEWVQQTSEALAKVINDKWAVNLLFQESYDGFSTPMHVQVAP